MPRMNWNEVVEQLPAEFEMAAEEMKAKGAPRRWSNEMMDGARLATQFEHDKDTLSNADLDDLERAYYMMVGWRATHFAEGRVAEFEQGVDDGYNSLRPDGGR